MEPGRPHAGVLAALPPAEAVARLPRARRGRLPRGDRAQPRPGAAPGRGGAPASPIWSCSLEPQLSVVPVPPRAARRRDLDAHNRLLADTIQAEADIYLAAATYDGTVGLRPCIVNYRTTRRRRARRSSRSPARSAPASRRREPRGRRRRLSRHDRAPAHHPRRLRRSPAAASTDRPVGPDHGRGSADDQHGLDAGPVGHAREDRGAADGRHRLRGLQLHHRRPGPARRAAALVPAAAQVAGPTGACSDCWSTAWCSSTSASEARSCSTTTTRTAARARGVLRRPRPVPRGRRRAARRRQLDDVPPQGSLDRIDVERSGGFDGVDAERHHRRSDRARVIASLAPYPCRDRRADVGLRRLLGLPHHGALSRRRGAGRAGVRPVERPAELEPFLGILDSRLEASGRVGMAAPGRVPSRVTRDRRTAAGRFVRHLEPLARADVDDRARALPPVRLAGLSVGAPDDHPAAPGRSRGRACR